jgi:formylglycine-generating enzyme required for sulfatase activity
MIRLFTLLLVALNLALLGWLCYPAPAGGEKAIGNSLEMPFVLIPAGKFLMGSPETEKGRGEDETQHEVTISQTFFLGVYEVTQGQFAKVMGKNPSWFSAQGGGKESVQKDFIEMDKLPVDDVTWQQAVEFCQKLGTLPAEKAQGRSYRLPTEAEWEYACRAGTTTVFHYGNTLNAYQANFCGLIYSSYGEEKAAPFLRRTTAVGVYPRRVVLEGKEYPSGPNAFGLFDMHGNVQEWCQDWYATDYYKKSPKADPPGPESGTERVLRGGGWSHSGKAVRCAVRNKLPPEETHYSAGFRVVMVK